MGYVTEVKAKAQALDQRMADLTEHFDVPADDSSQAMAAIEIALDLTDGSHSDALDVIAYSSVSGEAKAMAVETLATQEAEKLVK